MSSKNNVIPILIPAYNPDSKLQKLVNNLNKIKINPIVIVNDGSTKSSLLIFRNLLKYKNVEIINHKENCGKGRAIKTGLKYIKNHYKNNSSHLLGAITVDADGQHSPKDVFMILDTLKNQTDSLVLGVRNFNKQKIPFKSKLGNLITRLIFKLIVGFSVSDTQTGLRGIPYVFFNTCINLVGEKYDFELSMLIATKNLNIKIIEKNISTIYINKNESSHFRPIADSAKIYFVLFKFSLFALLSTLVDYFLFFLCIKLSLSIFVSLIISRIISGNFQYFFNKNNVFRKKGNFFLSFFKYWIIVIILGTLAYSGILLFNKFFEINLLLSKIIIESILFFCSFFIQRNFVFSKNERKTS